MKTITGHVEGSVIVLSEALELTPSSRLEITVLPADVERLKSEARLEQMMSVHTDRLYLSESALLSEPRETPAPQIEHCYAIYKFIGRGFTQELEWLRLNDQKQSQWKGKLFTDFLDDMASQGWKFLNSTVLATDYSYTNSVSYFRREKIFDL